MAHLEAGTLRQDLGELAGSLAPPAHSRRPAADRVGVWDERGRSRPKPKCSRLYGSLTESPHTVTALSALRRRCQVSSVQREPYRAGTFANSAPRPSAIVGWARIASRNSGW